jgi:hypothetical protein
MLMKSFVAGACVAIAVVLWSSSPLPAAQLGIQSRAWTHAYISRVGTDVFITYVDGQGCRDQRIEPDQFRSLNMPKDVSSTETLTMASAVTRLGNGGFELIGEGGAYCHTDNRRALHFKRALY